MPTTATPTLVTVRLTKRFLSGALEGLEHTSEVRCLPGSVDHFLVLQGRRVRETMTRTKVLYTKVEVVA